MADRRRVDPSRRAAYDVLRAVDRDDAYANLALGRVLSERGLSGRDAALVTELVGGTLRGQGTYDAILGSLVDRPLDPQVRDVLRLGTHQLLAMRVPDHAAISTSVDLIRGAVGHRPAGLVNAVLRRVSQRSRDAWVRGLAPSPGEDPSGYLAVAHSHPRWVVDALGEALEPADELEVLLSANNQRPAVTLVARPGLIEVQELVEQARSNAGPARAADDLPGGRYAVHLGGGDPGSIPAVRDGRAGVQDAGSQLVATALADAPLPGRDQLWLDLCAGPGGKAALLGALARQRGARVVANERSAHRARLVRQATRLSDVLVVTGDGRRPAWQSPGTFDRVLVDAPCSGLGALRRRPEARWRRRPEDLAELVPLQRELLTAGIDSLRPGGVLIYATCSPVLAETAGVVNAVLADRPGAVLEPLVDAAGTASARQVGALQLWTHRHGTDAMFLAMLRRT